MQPLPMVASHISSGHACLHQEVVLLYNNVGRWSFLTITEKVVLSIKNSPKSSLKAASRPTPSHLRRQVHRNTQTKLDSGSWVPYGGTSSPKS
jgi:hypothetical protein